MHDLNDLDLQRQHRRELQQEIENTRLAWRLRSAGVMQAPRPLLRRVRAALRPAPKEVSFEDCKESVNVTER